MVGSVPKGSRALRLGAFAVTCVALGVIAERVCDRREPAVIWREAPPRSVAGPVTPPTSFADIVERARPGIVAVEARLPVSAEEERIPDGIEGSSLQDENQGLRTGSGFIVSAQGFIVTSRHVVAAAESISVVVPGHGRLAAVVDGEDRAVDLALLRLTDPPPGLHALPLGRSEDLRAGDWIVAVGNPLGFQQTVTAGIVSFVGRHLPHSDWRCTSDFVQISAPVNPGNSGGPVLALDGSVVGVTTQAAVEAQGISFAVPSGTLLWSLERMIRSGNGSVQRGYLGIEFRTFARLDDLGAPCGGAEVVRVVRGAPADKGGLQADDVILAVNGDLLADAGELHRRITRGEPGQHLALRVLRGGRVQDSIEVVLGEMGGRAPPSWN